MSYYSIPLKAGIPFKQGTSGKLLLIDSISAGAGIDITFVKNGNETTVMPKRQPGFRVVEAFEAVVFTSAVDATLGVFLSSADVQLGFVSGGNVGVPGGVMVNNTAANRVPVDLGGAAIAVSINSIAVNNTAANPVPVSLISAPETDALTVKNQALSTLVNSAPVVAGLAAVQLVADTTLRRIVVRNASGAAKIAIGGPAVTMANGAIQLAPGDVWREDDAAGASWYVISDTAATSVQVMGIR